MSRRLSAPTAMLPVPPLPQALLPATVLATNGPEVCSLIHSVLASFGQHRVCLSLTIALTIAERTQTAENEDPKPLSSRLTLTLGAYVEGKVKQWDVELRDVNHTFSKNIKR